METDVLIVGAGIAGSALACALRDSGMKIVLIDKSDHPLDTARGDHLQPYTCEILERWGVLNDFFRAGAQKRAGAIWYADQGQEIMRSTVSNLAIPHPYFAFINHEKIASLLLAAALESQNVSCIRPIRNWWLENSDDSAQYVRVGLPDSAETLIRSKTIIGADGRQSRVRQTFGFTSNSHRYERSIAVFFASSGDVDPDRFLKVYLGDEVTTSVIPRTGAHCKIGLPLSTKDARGWRALDREDIERRVRQHCPGLPISDVEFSDIYPPVYLQTDSWVQGPIALTGDACHAMHPARSQGMNISIRCIDVLALKLANAPMPLTPDGATNALADYEAEMKPLIDAMLMENHQWGLQMDRADPTTNRGLRAKLEAIQSSSAALQAYSLQSAGYVGSSPA